MDSDDKCMNSPTPLTDSKYEYDVLYCNVNMIQQNRRTHEEILFENMIGSFKKNGGFQGDIFIRHFPKNKVEYTMENTAYSWKVV